MFKRKWKRFMAAVLTSALVLQMAGTDTLFVKAENASAFSSRQSANLDFENGLDGWETTGTVTVKEGGQTDGKYVSLDANSSITMTVTDMEQGSYTLSAWVKGTAGNSNTAKMEVTETGGPDAVALLNTYLNSDTAKWTQMGHRNVLVYNGQMKITISSGNSKLDLDNMELALDSADSNSISNWDFEGGLDGWTAAGTAEADTENADTGVKNIRLAADSEISQTVAVEPNTRYAVTMRAKVDRQDIFETEKVTNYRGAMGELVERKTLGDRVNLGVRTANGTVLRQAPSGTEDYSLVSLTFTTGADDHEVVIYANTKYDDNYKKSVTVHKTDATELADDWTGNGSDHAYVDNFDLFEIQDENYLRGADVSFLPAIEDKGGKYFANGVQQDCLTILSNHGVNSITGMIFVKAGNTVYNPNTLQVMYHDWWTAEDGSACEMKMISGGYFDKEHSLDLGKRATELGMSYLPSFHYSDYWMSNAKAYSPEEWLETDYEGNKSNTDLAHMQSMVYNYVYDFMSMLKENNVNVAGVKHGNEQNGGIVWPVGLGATSAGHAALIAASYDAAEDAFPGVSGYIHSNNGYSTSGFSNFFGALLQNGAKMDGAACSLYGGRSSGNTILMANAMLADDTMKYMDYVNVETGFSFTRYKATVDQQTGAMGQASFYNNTANGQYNWLLDYMQAPLDAVNPYGQTRGFYYWETDWIPTPGAASSEGGTADINARTMFNNGDPSIKEMGSSQDGKAGDMMDSMYAYLMRGCAKDKADTMQTPLKDAGTYSVEKTEPTGITLSKESLQLIVGETERLQPTIAPADKVLTDSNITYSSQDTSVAEVTHDGFVKAIAPGTTVVTAEAAGGLRASVNVAVTGGVQASADSLTVKIGGTALSDGDTKTAKVFDKIQLTADLADNVTNQNVIYSSSNPKVASFLGETWQTPDGVMRQQVDKDTKVQLDVKAKGETTITASAADGGASISFTLNTTKVDAENIVLNETEVSISYSRKLQLTAEVHPENTTFYKVNWTSDNEEVATVDETGLVTAVGIGDAVIRAASDDNAEIYAECTVHGLPVQVEGVTMDKSTLAIQVGSTKVLNVLISPSDANNKNVTWRSDDESIATVNDKGEVTGMAVGGPATITATTENGGFTASCEVTVQQDAIGVTGVSLSEKEYYFSSDYFSDTNPGEEVPSYRFQAVVEPETATEDDVIWESDTPEIASIDEFGRVTPVSSGVAKITATTKDGGFKASANVYVPEVSESFDNREAGDNWNMGVGSAGGGGMSAAVAAGEDGNTLQLTSSGSGGRSIQKKFSQAVTNDKLVVEFDWNVGAPVGSKGNYVTVTDSSNNRYLSIQTNTNTELVYSTGGQPVGNEPLSNTAQVGTGFNTNNTWYHVSIALNMKEKKAAFTITSLENPELTATHEVAYDPSVSFTGDISAVQFYATRSTGQTWNTAIDNFNIYKAAPAAQKVNVNKETVKLIPIEGTLGAGCQLSAQVYPESIAQDIVWTSSDTSLVTVSEKGLVTPVNLYQSLEEIVTGSCTIKAASANNPSIFKEVTVNISNNPNASENFSVIDEKGASVYNAGTGSEEVALETGDKKQFFAILTGGDGDTDIAGIKWESDNTEVVSVDADTGKLTAVGPGEAEITLTVTLYIGNPMVAKINIAVAGEVLAKTAELEDAVQAAKAAKTQPDSYYTEESITAYQKALEKAENDLQKASAEKWNSTKQSILDGDVAALHAAVEGLEQNTSVSIETIEIAGGDTPLALNKKVSLTASVMPEYATESVIWSSSDPTVAIVSKTDGTVIPVGEGTAVITAAGVKGKVTAQKEITVTSDLTSYYEENGITITSENTLAGRDDVNPFINARTMNYSGADGTRNGKAWSTGSATKIGSITADLGAAARIDNVKTCFWSQMKYTLDVSMNGTDWETAVDHSAEAAGKLSDGTEVYTDEFPADTVARYVRINVLENSGSGWIGITIIQVNGAFVLEQNLVDNVGEAAAEIAMDTELTPQVLPQTVSVSLKNGETREVSVTWDEAEIAKIAQKGEAGEYQVHGTVVVDEIAYDAVCTLNLTKVDIKDAQIVLEKDSYVYDGSEKKPGVTVTLNGKTLTDADYGVAYSRNIQVGTATAEITGKGKYTGTQTKNFTITEPPVVVQSLKDAVISLSQSSYVYDGTAKKPDVTVTLQNKELSAEDYTILYSKNVNAGTAAVTVTAKSDSYKDSCQTTFTIAKASIAKAAVTLSASSYIYDGTAKEPGVTVVLAGKTLVSGTDYTVAYKDNINAGTAAVTVTAKSGNYSGIVTKNFTITKSSSEPQSLKNAVISLSQNSYVYDGTEKKPGVTVTLQNKKLSAADYTVSYSSNVNAGTAVVTVTSKSDSYKDSCRTTFTIAKASIAKAAVTLSAGSYTYNGKAKKPGVKVVLAGKTLKSGTDYTVSYKNNTNAGKATVTITAKSGNYSSTITKAFTIKKASKKITVKKTSITKTYGNKAFSLGASTAKGEKLTYTLSNKKVIKISGGKAKIIGYGKVTVMIKSASSKNYNAASSKKITITVKPKKLSISSLKSKKAKQMTVSWKKDTKASGYEISYATNSKFKNAKKVTVKSYKTTSKTISKLSKGKTYYVRICSYKTVNGKKVYSDYSTVKKVKIKK